MREKQSSRTADYVAVVRALETVRPRPRLFEDPYAARFLRIRLLTRLASIAPLNRAIERGLDRKFPTGHRGNAVLRTRLIDDMVEDALSQGAEQVVLLGAGHDSRAYRMPAMRGAAVFEVDHPATQEVKRARVHRHVPPEHRGHVRFVPVDLLRDSLDECLRAAGFRTTRTVVVWEGVTNYLDAPSVDATIRWFAESTAPGSGLVFTYMDVRGLLRTGNGAGEVSDTFRNVGEPMTFGWDPDELPGYVAGHGLDLVRDLSAPEAAELYLTPVGRHDRSGVFSRIALAVRP